MSQVRFERAICAVCGEPCRFSALPPSSAVGSRDLDTRPPGTLRSTIYAWVRRCPSCGYCAPDISKALLGEAEVVRLPRYRKQLNARRFPQLADTFLCWSLLQEEAGALAKAARAGIHTAWVCDDLGADAAARLCRMRAADLLRRAWERGERLAPQEGADEAVPGRPGRCAPESGTGAESGTDRRRRAALPAGADRPDGPGRPHRRGGEALQTVPAALAGGPSPPLFV